MRPLCQGTAHPPKPLVGHDGSWWEAGSQLMNCSPTALVPQEPPVTTDSVLMRKSSSVAASSPHRHSFP